MTATNAIKGALWAFTIVASIFFLAVPRLAQWMEATNDAKVRAMGYTPSSDLLKGRGASPAEVKAAARGRFAVEGSSPERR
jgi:hypothetical protein